MRWKIIMITLFAVLIAVFTILNSTKVEVNFIIRSAEINLIFVILLSVLLGMILSTILWSVQTVKWRRKNKELTASLSAMQEQRTDLKSAFSSMETKKTDGSPIEFTQRTTLNGENENSSSQTD